jgi:NADH-quinone oxidoreductase subunit M
MLLIFSLANSSVPLTSGFIAEFMTLLSYWAHTNPVISLLAATSIILVPVFMLNVLHRISYGSFSPYLPTVYSDISTKELH